MSRDRPGKYDLYHEAVHATWWAWWSTCCWDSPSWPAGWWASRMPWISDAVNSLGDVFTSVAVLLAFRVAQKPADAEHPYGHTRAEAIAGSNVAVLVIVSALLVGWGALPGILRHTQRFRPPGRWPSPACNVVIKEAPTSTRSGWAVSTGSSAIIANAWDHRADALSRLAVLVGSCSSGRADHDSWRSMRSRALVVVVVIVTLGDAAPLVERQELMDAQAAGAFVDQIRGAAAAVPGVKRIDKLWVRKSGLEYLVDIHIQVRADQTVDEGHRISHLVKDELLKRFGNLRDVMVH